MGVGGDIGSGSGLGSSTNASGSGNVRSSSNGNGHPTSLKKGYKKLSNLWGKSAEHPKPSLAMFDQVNFDVRN